MVMNEVSWMAVEVEEPLIAFCLVVAGETPTIC